MSRAPSVASKLIKSSKDQQMPGAQSNNNDTSGKNKDMPDPHAPNVNQDGQILPPGFDRTGDGNKPHPNPTGRFAKKGSQPTRTPPKSKLPPYKRPSPMGKLPKTGLARYGNQVR